MNNTLFLTKSKKKKQQLIFIVSDILVIEKQKFPNKLTKPERTCASKPISIGFLFLHVYFRGRSEVLQKAHWHHGWKENREDRYAHDIF